jgi:ribosomal protein L31E
VDDLVLISGSVAFADRVVARKPSIAWRRNLSISIPVHKPDRWREPQLYRRLTETLDYLTGDNWTLTFTQRKHQTNIQPQARLPLGSDKSLVMPYSDGLDSFAVARLVAARNPGIPLVLVTTGNRKNPALDESNSALSRCMYRVAIPFTLSSRGGLVRHREPSYRSRAFVFGIMAGIAAYLLSAKEIFVAESGQGALGPWLTPVGNEAPDVRLHPSFTRRIGALLKLVLGTEVTHIHPQLWKTKGETLQELAQLGLADGWWLSSSCARDQRHVSLDNKRIQCGICAGCLLRRQSLHAAGLTHNVDTYLWKNLNAPSLSRAVSDRQTVRNDERQALCAVLEIQQFAEMHTREEHLRIAAEDLSPFLNEGTDKVEEKLRRLIMAHASEWTQFRSALGRESFINRWLDALQ